MKAVRISKYGGTNVLQLEDIEQPIPAPDEILIKVYASGVNPVDFAIRQGSIAALRYNLTLPMTLGWDAAGIIEETGSKVTAFKKGDEVYGVPNFPGDGSYAEYCAAKADRFSIKPTSLSFTESAGVPLIAMTAWTGIFKYGRLRPGQRILIQGAAGGVGRCAVQFAKAKGAYVIGTSSKDDFDYLKSIGVDEMIDYKTQPFEKLVQNVDVVLEASSVRNNKERQKAIRVLKDGGIFVSVNTDFPFNDEVIQALASKGAKGELSANEPRSEWLKEVAQLIDQGKVKVSISKVYSFDEAAKAHNDSETKQVSGKLILEIKNEERSYDAV